MSIFLANKIYYNEENLNKILPCTIVKLTGFSLYCLKLGKKKSFSMQTSYVQ